MWEGKSAKHGLYVITFPEAINRKILESYEITNTEQAISDYMKFKEAKNALPKGKSLYPYQEIALNDFFDNGGRHFLEMATGTGKTFTSVQIIKEAMTRYHCYTIVLTHQKDLQIQWFNELQTLDSCNVVMLGGYGDRNKTNYNVQMSITKHMSGMNSVIISTFDTFFDKVVSKISQLESESLIVIDESHNLSKNQFIKLPNVKYRVGLSATPEKKD